MPLRRDVADEPSGRWERQRDGTWTLPNSSRTTSGGSGGSAAKDKEQDARLDLIEEELDALQSATTFCGTWDPNTETVTSVTDLGAQRGYVVGEPLPPYQDHNTDYLIADAKGPIPSWLTPVPDDGVAQFVYPGDWVIAGKDSWLLLRYSAREVDHGALIGLEDDDHPQYLTEARGDALYDAKGAASSGDANHVAAADPHAQYLTSSEHGGTGDPHPQYLTQTEADALFLTPAEGNAAYDAKGTAAAGDSAHVGAADPHPQYATDDHTHPGLGAAGRWTWTNDHVDDPGTGKVSSDADTWDATTELHLSRYTALGNDAYPFLEAVGVNDVFTIWHAQDSTSWAHAVVTGIVDSGTWFKFTVTIDEHGTDPAKNEDMILVIEYSTVDPDLYVQKSGDTMTGHLAIPDATLPEHAMTLGQAEADYGAKNDEQDGRLDGLDDQVAALESSTTYVGTFDAANDVVASVTTIGANLGYVVGQPLPSHVGHQTEYLIVAVAGAMPPDVTPVPPPPEGVEPYLYVGDWVAASATGWIGLRYSAREVDHGHTTGLGDDDHPQYLTEARGDARYDALGAASSGDSAHTGASDPHPQYTTQNEADARYVMVAGDTMTGQLNVNALLRAKGNGSGWLFEVEGHDGSDAYVIDQDGNHHFADRTLFNMGQAYVNRVDLGYGSSVLNINAADARYALPARLGAYAKNVADWNDALQNGWYMASSALNSPPINNWLPSNASTPKTGIGNVGDKATYGWNSWDTQVTVYDRAGADGIAVERTGDNGGTSRSIYTHEDAFPLTPGETYEVCFEVYVPDGTEPSANCILQSYGADGAWLGNDIYIAHVPLRANNWNTYTARVTAPAGAVHGRIVPVVDPGNGTAAGLCFYMRSARVTSVTARWHIGLVTNHNDDWVTQVVWAFVDLELNQQPLTFMRRKMNGLWGPWMLMGDQHWSNLTDFNNLNKPGMYRFEGGVPNNPPTVGDYGNVLVVQGRAGNSGPSDTLFQIAAREGEGIAWRGARAWGEAWSPWKALNTVTIDTSPPGTQPDSGPQVGDLWIDPNEVALPASIAANSLSTGDWNSAVTNGWWTGAPGALNGPPSPTGYTACFVKAVQPWVVQESYQFDGSVDYDSALTPGPAYVRKGIDQGGGNYLWGAWIQRPPTSLTESDARYIYNRHPVRAGFINGSNWGPNDSAQIPFELNQGDPSLWSGSEYVCPVDGWYHVALTLTFTYSSGTPMFSITLNGSPTMNIQLTIPGGFGGGNGAQTDLQYLAAGTRIGARYWDAGGGNAILVPGWRHALVIFRLAN